MAGLRMSEEEAIKRGLLPTPPATPTPDADAGKRLYQEMLARHRRKATGQGFMLALLFISGWIVGFACALLFLGNGYR